MTIVVPQLRWWPVSFHGYFRYLCRVFSGCVWDAADVLLDSACSVQVSVRHHWYKQTFHTVVAAFEILLFQISLSFAMAGFTRVTIATQKKHSLHLRNIIRIYLWYHSCSLFHQQESFVFSLHSISQVTGIQPKSYITIGVSSGDSWVGKYEMCWLGLHILHGRAASHNSRMRRAHGMCSMICPCYSCEVKHRDTHATRCASVERRRVMVRCD